MPFTLNERLAKGGFDFGKHGICRILLKNNNHFHWFILVPEIDESIIEIHQLSDREYQEINGTTQHVARFIAEHFSPEKINIGNIGNVVRQMHVHVIGRTFDDPAWPGVVWSCPEKRPYQPQDVSAILAAYKKFTQD